MMISEGIVAEKHHSPEQEQATLEARALELHKASLKLSGFLDNSTFNQQNSFSGYPIFQGDGPESSEIYSKVSKDLQTELGNETFAAPAKALDTWAAHLNPQQLLTVICLVFKRMDQPQIETVQELINLGKNEPAFFFGKLTSKGKDNEGSRSQAEVESINNILSALSFVEAPARRASDNPFRYSMPITRDFSLTPSRYDHFPSKREESCGENGDSFSRPKSFQEDNLSVLISPDWTSSSTVSPATATNSGNSPPINRIRPKSMYEPGMLNRAWQQEEQNDSGRHLPVGEADALTWNIPLSPTVQKIRHPLTSQSSQASYGSVSFSEDLPPPRKPSHPTEQYSNPGSYSAGLPPRGGFHQSNSPIPRAGHMQMGPPYFSGFSPTSPATWLGFKEKPKRRSYGDHDIFPQGARSMFSNLPNTFKKHLMKPQNKVDFDILQDVSAWLRSLRLHKYTNVFDGMVWQDIIKLNDEELVQKGISALGARRKMLKHFELIKQELQNKSKEK